MPFVNAVCCNRPDQILDKTLVVLHGKDELLEVEKVGVATVLPQQQESGIRYWCSIQKRDSRYVPCIHDLRCSRHVQPVRFIFIRVHAYCRLLKKA